MANANSGTTSLWAYRADLGVNDRDLTGYEVDATDGQIGKIDEASQEWARPTWSSTPASGSSARSG